jgi:general secretion pathway protein K
MRGERGFALVITLLVTALLTALLVEFVSEVYVDASHSHNFVASQQASILAESGIAGGIQLLNASSAARQIQGQTASTLQELWAKPYTYDAGVGTVTIGIEEESGKLDLNSVVFPNGKPVDFYSDVAQRLFKNLGFSNDLYDALADWVDTDDAPRPGGAETSYYSTLKPPYQAHNVRLNTFEELAQVKGFTPQVLTKLRSCTTVYGGQAGGVAPAININTAPRELLASLDQSLTTGDLVDRILEYRKTKAITNLADIPGLGTLVQSLALRVSYKGLVYRIHAEGKVGDSVSVAEAVVSNVEMGGKPTILYWREY